MIALLRGVLLEKHPNQAIVETGGVGYDVTIPVSTYTHLPDAGTEVRLRIHTHVREDALALYGFLTQDEKGLFEKLIGVSGIGPKLAVTILSGLAAPDLIHAIGRGEVERLVRIPGIGKKTAERMLVELRDRVDDLGPAATTNGAVPKDPVAEATVALQALGYKPAEVTRLVRDAAAPGDRAEEIIRKALKAALR
jgi:holliday junction DNA helicase RuvA